MQPPFNYPLTLSFKILALAPQISVHDANGNLLFYVRQKLFKLKEAVTVFADQEQQKPLYQLDADRIIDWSANYNFTKAGDGKQIGSIKRQGMRSLWKARYDITSGQKTGMDIEEENGWVKVMDGLFGEIPIIGILSGYLFHPAYLMKEDNGEAIYMRMEKQPAFFEGKFQIEKRGKLEPDDEEVAILSYIMMVLLERRRS